VMTRALAGVAAGDGADTVDALALDRLDGIAVELPADAGAILAGATDTLWRTRPWLVLEVEDDASWERAASVANAHGYRTWRMDTPWFRAPNFNRRDDDAFAGRSSLALVALPEEVDFDGAPAGCVESP